MTNNSAQTFKVQLDNPEEISIDHDLYIRKRNTSFAQPKETVVAVQSVSRIEPIVGHIIESNKELIYKIFNPNVCPAM